MSKQPKRGKLIKQGIRDSLSILWSQSKSVSLICALAVVLRVALPYIGILMPKVVLDQIEMQTAPRQFIITVGGMALLLIAVNYFKRFTDSAVDNTVGIAIQNRVLITQLRKYMDMDYENLESPEFRELDDKATKAMHSNRSPASNIPRMAVEMLSNCAGFLLYAGVIVLIHPLILAVLAVTAAVNWLMLSRARKYMEKTRDERSKFSKRLYALSNTMRDPEAAKDIRLYNAYPWLSGLYKTEYADFRNAEGRLLTKNMHAHLTDALMILLRDGAAYALLIWLVLQDRLSLGDFVFVFAAVGALAGWISGILTSVGDIAKACVEWNDIIVELDYPDRMNTAAKIVFRKETELPPSIELHGVSYTYPKAEKPAINNINLTISSGERLAIVGANGAGKTTLVKLICGLYIPSDGEILLNRQPVSAFNRDEYYNLFSAVFQDIHLLASGIEENVSQKPTEQTDRAKVLKCLDSAGLTTKVNTLPEGTNSLMVRSVNPDGIELSGGEEQKLAMARALYKDAPVLVLDEPTAALDPIAESEVYSKYAGLTEGKTSVFISHRLASTRFCDRIVLLDGSEIAEEGTHEELMELGGIYANMFTVQASYYQEGEGVSDD